ncbi:hypothetical protein V8Z81_31950 (plasmid) [Priestia megaterium]|uniref:hypothetical protein n=1 Tax=Priestia megaterium TaxID=1404 RepID=UPI0030CCD756
MFPYFTDYSTEDKKLLAKVRVRHRKLNPTEFSLYMTIRLCSSLHTKENMLDFEMNTPIINWCRDNGTMDIMVVILNTCKFSNINYQNIDFPHHSEILHHFTTIRDVFEFLLPYTPTFTDGTFYEHDIDFDPYW